MRFVACLHANGHRRVHAGADEIAHFNGDLFNVVDTVELSTVALQRLGEACDRNWRDIEPSIFGTLFERALDASKRAQTGAHYTGADDIEAGGGTGGDDAAAPGVAGDQGRD